LDLDVTVDEVLGSWTSFDLGVAPAVAFRVGGGAGPGGGFGARLGGVAGGLRASVRKAAAGGQVRWPTGWHALPWVRDGCCQCALPWLPPGPEQTATPTAIHAGCGQSAWCAPLNAALA
jgi:hypothetical protein